MKTRIIVTDLTRMYGRNVCIAGYDEERRCIRPVTPAGIDERTLLADGSSFVFPFALVELQLTEPDPSPPHTEDYGFKQNSFAFIKIVKDREKVLKWSIFATVKALFEQRIHTGWGFYVTEGHGVRSLGTIRPARIDQVTYEPAWKGDTWDYRIHFIDEGGTFYRLKITDLTWQYYCNSLRSPDLEPNQIAIELTEMLRSRKVYLRIGLARRWSRFPDRCYLQVTGVYTFPDYLEGKIFTDFYLRT